MPFIIITPPLICIICTQWAHYWHARIRGGTTSGPWYAGIYAGIAILRFALHLDHPWKFAWPHHTTTPLFSKRALCGLWGVVTQIFTDDPTPSEVQTAVDNTADFTPLGSSRMYGGREGQSVSAETIPYTIDTTWIGNRMRSIDPWRRKWRFTGRVYPREETWSSKVDFNCL